MQDFNEQLKKRGVRHEITYSGENGRIRKEYKYRGMYITWDNFTLNGRWYYWRTSYYSSLEGALDSIDRHIKLYKKQTQ